MQLSHPQRTRCMPNVKMLTFAVLASLASSAIVLDSTAKIVAAPAATAYKQQGSK